MKMTTIDVKEDEVVILEWKLTEIDFGKKN
jgi:hypothetical protein